MSPRSVSRLRLTILLLNLLAAQVSLAQSQGSAAISSQSEEISSGFTHFYNLEYQQAIQDFKKAIAVKPNDPTAYNHLAQAVLYREMFRSGALESELVSGSNAFLRRAAMNPSAQDQEEFTSAIQQTMGLCEPRLKANPDDIPALYALGVAHGLRANYSFLVKKAWIDSLRDATAARKLHNRITDLDPSFQDARLVQGVHDYVIGSLPRLYKMLGFVAGFRGDREAGIQTLREVAAKGSLNRYDAQVLLSVIYRRERRAEEALPLLQTLSQRFSRNYLLRLELAQMYADAGRKEDALATLRTVEQLKRSNAPGFDKLPLEKVFYYEGNIRFWYNDLDMALARMQNVAAKSDQLDLNTGLYAQLRIGQIHDMKGQREQAIQAYRKAVAMEPHSEVARESKSYLSSPYRRTK